MSAFQLSDLALVAIILAVGAFIVRLFINSRTSSTTTAAAKKNDAPNNKSAAVKPKAGTQPIDAVLRNRHGIQNGEMKEWTLAEVAKHNKPDDLFIVVYNKVYDVSDFVEDHPGGNESIARLPGKDNTEGFSGIQHPAKVWDMLPDYYVGDVVKSEHVTYTFKVISKI